MSKRIIVISDTHSGHLSGLAPPGHQSPIDHESLLIRKMAEFQRRTWDWFAEEIKRISRIDALVYNGDAIEGKGERSGGTELISSDRIEQTGMGVAIMKFIDAPFNLMTFGTRSHVGDDEDWEQIIADKVGCHIGTHEWLEVEGVTIDFKHKVSSSAIPHGRHTAPSRARLWNSIWAERKMQPNSQMLVRSHAHYYDFSGDSRGVAIITPALQGWTKYGSKECEGTVDFGFLEIICDNGRYEWIPHLMDMEFNAAKAHLL